jgi:hypothetical protein
LPQYHRKSAPIAHHDVFEAKEASAMNIFGRAVRRSVIVAATLAATAIGSLAVTAPAQARDSFSFGYSDGWSGFSVGVNDRGRDRWDRRDRWEHRDRWDRRDYWRHRDYRPRYYYPQRYRYVEPPPYYYAPRPYYYYGY